MQVSRRTVLIGSAAATMAPVPSRASPSLSADDEAGWAAIAAQYPVTTAITQLENGYWGSMASPVIAAHRAILDKLNRNTSWYGRRAMLKDQKAVIERAAAAMGVQPQDIGLAGNAAQGLSALISQFRGVGQGDRILYSDTDYEAMQGAMISLARARGAEAIKLTMPRVLTHDGVIQAYRAAIATTPRLKLVLLTHMSHRHGLVLPVAQIAPLAKAAGADVIVDAAQSFYQLPFKLPDLGADFVGLNFHKWVGAPLGVAAIWIAPGRMNAIAPSPQEPDGDTVQSRCHQGTVDFSAQLALPAALDFQAGIDPAAKLARLQYLRDRWVKPLRGLAGLEILGSDDPRIYASSTSFRIAGNTSSADNIAITDVLLERFGIMTVERTGLTDGGCIRVTPSLFTSPGAVDRLVPALTILVAERAR